MCLDRRALVQAVLREHRPGLHSCAHLAAIVGLDASDVGPDGLEPELVSCGLPCHVVPVASTDAVRRAVLDLGRGRAVPEIPTPSRTAAGNGHRAP